MQAKLKAYYRLAKPGIIYGNMMVAVGAFLFAAAGRVDGLRFIGLLLGLSGVIGSACVFNNYLDRHIDQKKDA